MLILMVVVPLLIVLVTGFAAGWSLRKHYEDQLKSGDKITKNRCYPGK
jgi:uncharacterized protein YneF (UPF0154 family)